MLALTAAAFATNLFEIPEPADPPFHFDKTLPELTSPAVVTMDARWLRSLPLSEWTDITDIPRFHCDGAVIRRIEIGNPGGIGSHLRLYLRFHVGLRNGDDRDITIDYDLLDGDRVVGSGKVKTQNLDEHATTTFVGSIKLAKREFDKLIADGGRPTFRVTMTIEEQ